MLLDLAQLANPSDPDQAQKAMQDTIAQLDLALSLKWQQITAKLGMAATLDNGVVVQSTDDAVTQYVAKWGHIAETDNHGWTAAHELAKAVTKKGRKGGRTPMQLLYDYAFNYDDQAGLLFVEFVKAFKGKRQLQYTKGLKRMLGLQDLTDEQIAADDQTPYDLLASLDIEQWRVILANDKRAEVLNVASEGDPDVLQKYLDSLPGMNGTRPFYD
jgi:hypothetical protein